MRTTFSQQVIADLKKHPCVFTCTEKSIYYTYEFKKYALEIYEQGVISKLILRRLRTLRDGMEGLHNTGGLPYDRGPKNTDKDAIKRLKLQVAYLKAENSFLAQLRAKRAERNSGCLKNTRSLKKITCNVTYLCKLAHVSLSGYCIYISDIL